MALALSAGSSKQNTFLFLFIFLFISESHLLGSTTLHDLNPGDEIILVALSVSFKSYLLMRVPTKAPINYLDYNALLYQVKARLLRRSELHF